MINISVCSTPLKPRIYKGSKNECAVRLEEVTADQVEHYRQRVNEAITAKSRLFCAPCEAQIDITGSVNVLTEIIRTAAIIAFPVKKLSSKPCSGKPRWSPDLQRKKEACMLWRNVWIANSKPHCGEVSSMYFKAKADFKYACRSFKKSHEEEVWRALADRSSPKKFWSKVKEAKDGKHKTVQQIVDNCTKKDNVAELFACSFADACKPWDPLAAIHEDTMLNTRLSSTSEAYVPITPEEIISAIRLRLKAGKATDVFECKAELFIFAANELAVPLANLFSHMLSSGSWPRMLACSIFSLC